MKSCPNGAIVNRDELAVIAGGLTVAIEHIDLIINSETRPNRRFHDAEYLKQMSALKDSRRIYEQCLNWTDRMLVKCS